MKKIIYRFCMILILGSSTHVVSSEFNFDNSITFENSNNDSDFGFENSFSFDDNTTLDQGDDLDSLTSFANKLSEDEVNAMRSCTPGQAAIISGFLSILGAPAVFDEPWFWNVSIPPTRNIINYPEFFLFSFKNPMKKQVTFYPFYNETHKKNFVEDKSVVNNYPKKHVKNGQRIGSYLNIENPAIVSTLNNALDLAVNTFGLVELSDLNACTMLRTLGNAYIEERRLGMIAHYYQQLSSKTFFEVRLPVLWMIRNLNFAKRDQDRIRENFKIVTGVLTGETSTCEFDEIEFGKQHLIMDAIGFGTTDLSVFRQIYDSQTADVYAGLALYLPTDGHWAQGLYGTYFNPKNYSPSLDLCEIVDEAGTGLVTGAGERIANYFLSATDQLSSMLLQCPLGYSKHMAVALKVLPYWQIMPNLTYSGLYIFEYLLPGQEDRFFVKKPSEIPFSKQFEDLDGNPEAQIALFEAELTRQLFPRTYTAKVSPGFILNTITNLQFSHKTWNFLAGYNWWYKAKENISDIQATKEELINLNMSNCYKQSASQVKLYTKIQRFIESSHNTISLSIFGDYTVYANNIGNDFTFGFSFDKRF